MAIHSNRSGKKRKKKVKPVYVEHVEEELEEAVSSDAVTTIEELDSLLTDRSISHKMRSQIESYTTQLKRTASAAGGIGEPGAELVWDPLQEADLASSSSISNTGDECMGQVPEDLEKMDSESDLFLNSLVTDKSTAMSELRKVTSTTLYKNFDLKGNKNIFDRAMAAQSEQKAKDFQDELLSFVDVCIETGMLQMAYTVVTVFYLQHKQGSKDPWKKHNISIYNVLMEAMARRGSLKITSKLYHQITDLALKPNLDTYAAYLECLGRQKVVPIKTTSFILEDVKKHGLVLEEMPNKCLISDENWRYVERAVLEVNPDFIPDTRSYQRGYSSELLAKLNDIQEEPFENSHSGVLTNAELVKLVDEQIEFEMKESATVKSIRAKKSVNPLKSQKMLEEVKAKWKKSLSSAFESNLRVGEHIYKKRCFMSVVPYLRLFPVETYVDLMIQKVINLCQNHEEFSPQIGALHTELGHQVYNLYLTRKLREKKTLPELTDVYKAYVQETNEATLEKNLREVWLEEDHPALHVRSLRPWSLHIKKQVGNFMLDMMLSDVKIDQNLMKPGETPSYVSALYKVMRQRGRYSSGFELKPHGTLANLIKSAIVDQLHFMPQNLPSLAPPIPWCTEQFGADIKGMNPFMRAVESTNVCSEQLYGVFDALNSLGHTAWKVNQPILDILIYIFNQGGNKKLSMPLASVAFSEIPKRSTKKMERAEKIKYYVERDEQIKLKTEEYSLWCSELYRLSIANQYRDRVFWFPHNMDFRGRAYPCSPHFSHIGGDLARSMLMFGKGKPLGPTGLDWLKIHLINLTGIKKRFANKDRLAYANEMMDEIEDSADEPLTGRQWWAESEEPWQTLATCMEITRATRSPDPQTYVCHLPVHQDGSCNGLQHYAALGRDSKGATSVNLEPSWRPKDVYSDVVELVEQRRMKDAAQGLKIAQLLDGFVLRKVIKQTIMTTVYGVTPFGAMQQIKKALQDMEEFPAQHVEQAGPYLAKKTLESLRDMFTSSKQIQDWLVLCAEVVSGLQHLMEWETPLGLPVVQNYKKNVTVMIPGTGTNKLTKVNKFKQRNAIAPNFVHSLDATHMMLSALHCQRAGITFASVHDCYWTHPCDVSIMNRVCREQFIALHKQPILEDLAESLLERYGFKQSDFEDKNRKAKHGMKFINTILSRVPQKGDFDLDEVLKSTYFFS